MSLLMSKAIATYAGKKVATDGGVEKEQEVYRHLKAAYNEILAMKSAWNQMADAYKREGSPLDSYQFSDANNFFNSVLRLLDNTEIAGGL